MENVFRNKNFCLVFLGTLVSDMGATLYNFAVSFYILEVSHNNAFLQGFYLFICGLMLMLSTPIGGVMGDHFNKVKIMYVCDYLKGILILLCMMVMLLNDSDVVHLLVLFIAGFFGNVIGGIFSPSGGSLLPQIVNSDQLQQANSYNSIKNSLQSVIGVVLAGILYATLSIHVLFLIVGICYILSAISEMFIRYDYEKTSEMMTMKFVVEDFKDGLSYLKSQKALIALMSGVLFINFFVNPLLSNFIPFFIKTDIATVNDYLFANIFKPEMWSSVFSVLFGISTLAGSIIMSTRSKEENTGLKLGIRFCVMALTISMMASSYYLLVYRNGLLNMFIMLFSLGCLIIGFLIAFINIPINTIIMKMVDKNQLGKVTGIINILSQGLIPISAMLSGIILQYLGSIPLLIFSSVGFGLTAIYVLFNKRVREL